MSSLENRDSVILMPWLMTDQQRGGKSILMNSFFFCMCKPESAIVWLLDSYLETVNKPFEDIPFAWKTFQLNFFFTVSRHSIDLSRLCPRPGAMMLRNGNKDFVLTWNGTALNDNTQQFSNSSHLYLWHFAVGFWSRLWLLKLSHHRGG